jgi:hypothetical protein
MNSIETKIAQSLKLEPGLEQFDWLVRLTRNKYGVCDFRFWSLDTSAPEGSGRYLENQAKIDRLFFIKQSQAG